MSKQLTHNTVCELVGFGHFPTVINNYVCKKAQRNTSLFTTLIPNSFYFTVDKQASAIDEALHRNRPSSKCIWLIYTICI